jgi:hypothetical protein
VQAGRPPNRVGASEPNRASEGRRKNVQTPNRDRAGERPILWRIKRDYTDGPFRPYGGHEGEATAWGVYLVMHDYPHVHPWKITLEYLDGRQANAVDARRRVQRYVRDTHLPGRLIVGRDGRATRRDF